jgi:outer membrane protein assembly factor BamB
MRFLTAALLLPGFVLLLPASFACSREKPAVAGDRPGSDERRELGPGRWRRRAVVPEALLTAQQRRGIENLEALGYVGGSQPRVASGITLVDPEGSSRGVNLYTDGGAPEAVLVTTDGEVLHRWRYEFVDAFPNTDRDATSPPTQWWRHAELLPDGSLLAIYGGQGLIKLARDSRLLWASSLRAHHELQVMPDGSLYVLTREANLLPWADPDEPVLEDFLTRLDADGNVLAHVSLVEAFYDSPFRYLLEEREGAGGDVLHVNSLQVLDGRLAARFPHFAAGNVLISSRRTSAIAVVDAETGKVVWAHRGDFREQHDAKVLATGNILLFDNSGLPGESRILELSLETLEPIWEYLGTREHPFYSEFLGAVERLPNGSTLVTDSNQGRAFEVTPEGEIVWEFYTPHTAGEQDEFIASLSRMHRLPVDFDSSWIPR